MKKKMTDETKQTIKRWVISSILSFLTGFALIIFNDIDSISISSFKDGSLVGLIFLATRAGIKAILELFLARKTILGKFKK